MEDKQSKCECGKEFVITIGEQTFYTGKGLNLPKHCPDCRKRRKGERLAREAAEALKKKNESSPFHPRNWREGKQVRGSVDEFVDSL